MKTLILYATKSGSSFLCAKLLAEKIPDSLICDIAKSTSDIEKAECIVLGSGIRMGHLYKPVRNFVKQNLDMLLSKKVAIYLCNSYPDTLQKTIEKDIPHKLLQKLVFITSFGGIPPFSTPNNTNWIQTENINTMVNKIIEKTNN